MTGPGDHPNRALARDRWLAALTVAWLTLALVLWGWAVTSPWAPSGQAPTSTDVARAHTRVLLSGAASVGLPLVAVVLAARWDRPRDAALLAAGAVVSAVVTAALWVMSS